MAPRRPRPAPAPAAPAPAGHAGHARAGGARIVLVVIALVLIAWLGTVALVLRAAALPPEASGRMFVLFPPGTSNATAFAAILDAGGAPLRVALGEFGWIVHGEEPGLAGRLAARGALAAFPGLPAGMPLVGCLGMLAEPAARPVLPIRP